MRMRPPFSFHCFPSEARMKASRKRYLAHFPRGGQVLDLGCGRGEFLELLRDGGMKGMGVEVDPALVEICRNKGLRVKRADALSIFEETCEQWDGIFIGHLIEHLEPEAVCRLLGEASRCLSPGGRIVILTPNPNFLPGVGPFWSDLTHRRPYPLRSLVLLFKELGLEVISSGVEPASKLRVHWKDPLGSAINLVRLFLLRLIVLEEYDGDEIFIVGEKP